MKKLYWILFHTVSVLPVKWKRTFILPTLILLTLLFLAKNSVLSADSQPSLQEHGATHSSAFEAPVEDHKVGSDSLKHENMTSRPDEPHASQDPGGSHRPEVEDSHAKGGAGAFAHGAPRVGYIGLASGAAIDAAELKTFKERVMEEAIDKGKLDQARFIFFALSFLMVWLAYARIEKLETVSKRIREALDWHTLGTVTGLILIVLVIPSGIIITFYYMPTSTEVYGSVEYMTAQPVLAFFRNLHNWSSEFFIWLLLLHAARTVSTRTYLGKRKFIWLAGVVASVIGWVAFLSGTFMRGDQEALEGFIHMMYSFTLFSGGSFISDFFSGEFTLIRLTVVHIIATVFIMAVFLTMHVLMRRVHVLVTHHWKKSVVYTGVLTVFMVIQSILMEAPFIRGLAGISSVSGVEYTKPPWPIYFLIQGENWFGADAMVAILAVVFIPAIIFPYALGILPLSNNQKILTGEITAYAGIFLLILVSYIAAAGPIQAHIF